MDNLSIALFTITSLSLLAGAVWLIYSAASSKPVRDYNAGRLSGEWTTQVKKPVHPEMQDVQPGEQLMGVTFKSKEVTECNIDDYKDLQARIDQLRDELGGDEDEDDDGGDVVISRL